MIDTDKYEGHTPGPWTIDGRHEYVDIREKDGPTITATVVLDSNYDLELQNEMSANARLIADAPLLLEEVKRLRDFIQSVWDGLGEAGRNEHYELFKEYMGEEV